MKRVTLTLCQNILSLKLPPHSLDKISVRQFLPKRKKQLHAATNEALNTAHGRTDKFVTHGVSRINCVPRLTNLRFSK